MKNTNSKNSVIESSFFFHWDTVVWIITIMLLAFCLCFPVYLIMKYGWEMSNIYVIALILLMIIGILLFVPLKLIVDTRQIKLVRVIPNLIIPLSEIEFVEKNLDVTEILDKDDLIQKIDEMDFDTNEYVKIILTGKRNFEINTYELYKLINQNQVIKIKDRTKINYDLEKISNESTLKGIFAKKMLEKLNNDIITAEEKEIIEKAIEIGFEALE